MGAPLHIIPQQQPRRPSHIPPLALPSATSRGVGLDSVEGPCSSPLTLGSFPRAAASSSVVSFRSPRSGSLGPAAAASNISSPRARKSKHTSTLSPRDPQSGTVAHTTLAVPTQTLEPAGSSAILVASALPKSARHVGHLSTPRSRLEASAATADSTTAAAPVPGRGAQLLMAMTPRQRMALGLDPSLNSGVSGGGPGPVSPVCSGQTQG